MTIVSQAKACIAMSHITSSELTWPAVFCASSSATSGPANRSQHAIGLLRTSCFSTCNSKSNCGNRQTGSSYPGRAPKLAVCLHPMEGIHRLRADEARCLAETTHPLRPRPCTASKQNPGCPMFRGRRRRNSLHADKTTIITAKPRR